MTLTLLSLTCYSHTYSTVLVLHHQDQCPGSKHGCYNGPCLAHRHDNPPTSIERVGLRYQHSPPFRTQQLYAVTGRPLHQKVIPRRAGNRTMEGQNTGKFTCMVYCTAYSEKKKKKKEKHFHSSDDGSALVSYR
ncbi:hypothetical protein HOY82DRAFT_208104 [Tuber indicum]|nr:hypothetical protein HOY82DRAFT_208104 [Tuber indicum]